MFPDWSNHVAVVLASGPSLTAEDCDLVAAAPVKTIAVNATFRRAPWADIVYMGDMMAVKTYEHELGRTTTAARWTRCPASAQRFPKWNRAPSISMGGNSGHQAISMAAAFGARRILLLGFDMQPAASGQRHWHAEHPRPCNQRSLFDEWLLKLARYAKELDKAGVELVNCSRTTAIDFIPRGVLEEELALCLKP